ncbi:hypothetical protein MMC07_005111 [Pseudocyphellaria aurata]|nr:hypothetical protein [Pseudocyphellaria aurata]
MALLGYNIREHTQQAKRRFIDVQRYNIRTSPQTLTGTLLPILLALSHDYISLSSTLVYTGQANILTGVLFGIPLPVQPVKAIATVALARKFNKAEVSSAGLSVAGVIGFLSITGLIPAFPRVPFALLILVIGIIKSLPEGVNKEAPYGYGIWKPIASVPSHKSFRDGALEAGLGQVPLTTLKSIFAVSLSADLLPKVESPSPTAMGLSVMMINLIGCWFGAMPVCHSSGGLAAQYRFGAPSGSSIIFLGLLKLLLGLFAGNFTLNIFSEFPNSLLSIMVIAAGLELVNVGESLNTSGARDLRELDCGNRGDDLGEESGSGANKDLTETERKRRWAVMLITVGDILAFKNDAVGFLAGMLCHWSFKLQDRLDARYSQREGAIKLQNDDPDGVHPFAA